MNNCFFVVKPYRRQGLQLALLRAAIEYAKRNGAQVIEGYPIEPRPERKISYDGYTGFVATFRKAGFRKVRKRIGDEVISRYLYMVEPS